MFILFFKWGALPPNPRQGLCPCTPKTHFFQFFQKKSPISNFPKKILFFPKTSLEKPKFSIYFLKWGALPPNPRQGLRPCTPKTHFFQFFPKKNPILNFPKKILFFPKTSLEKPKFSIYFLKWGALPPNPRQGLRPCTPKTHFFQFFQKKSP